MGTPLPNPPPPRGEGVILQSEAPPVAHDADRIARALAARLGAARVVTDQARLARYRGIAWGAPTWKVPLARPPAAPLLAVRPATAEDVVAVVKLAQQSGTPIVPHGAGTGVHAGATPVEGSILLDIGSMDRIHRVSRQDRTATVQAGVLLGDLDHAASAKGLLVGHDPWSQPIASVGGAVSTNGVGYLAGKYGAMGEQVVGMEVVLASGEVLRTRPVPKSSTGPSLRNLFIGAEGVFGIITEIDVRLFPIPELRLLAGYRFPRFEAGLEAVVEMASLQLRPSMIDYEEESAGSDLHVGVLADLPSMMFLAFEGFREQAEAERRRADEICRRLGGEPREPAEAERFWDRRHEPAERYQQQLQLDPQGVARSDRLRRWTSSYLNLGMRASTIQEFRQRAARELVPYRLVVKDSGLWGMPELYSVRLEHLRPDDPRAPDELDAGTEAALRIAHELGGSMEYCHGVGLRLAHLMGAELGVGLDVLRRMKQALDPNGLLNPGKLGL